MFGAHISCHPYLGDGYAVSGITAVRPLAVFFPKSLSLTPHGPTRVTSSYELPISAYRSCLRSGSPKSDLGPTRNSIESCWEANMLSRSEKVLLSLKLKKKI